MSSSPTPSHAGGSPDRSVRRAGAAYSGAPDACGSRPRYAVHAHRLDAGVHMNLPRPPWSRRAVRSSIIGYTSAWARKSMPSSLLRCATAAESPPPALEPATAMRSGSMPSSSARSRIHLNVVMQSCRANDHPAAVNMQHGGTTHSFHNRHRDKDPDRRFTVDVVFRHRHTCARVRPAAHAQPAHPQRPPAQLPRRERQQRTTELGCHSAIASCIASAQRVPYPTAADRSTSRSSASSLRTEWAGPPRPSRPRAPRRL